MSQPIVAIFGPSLNDPGGMASVERVHRDMLRSLGYAVEHRPTYSSLTRFRGAHLYLGALLFALRLQRTHSIAHLHVSQRGSIVRGTILATLLRWRGIPIVCTIHGSGFRPFARQHPSLTRALVRRSKFITVLSQLTADAVRELEPSARIAQIPNAVSVPVGDIPLPSSGRDILFAGELSRRKGLDILLAAWSRIPDSTRRNARLLLAGPSADIQIPTQGDVEWLGVLTRDEMVNRLARCRAGVLPSRAEALPMFILEVMASGRPIITTEIEDLKAVVGGGGTTIPPGSVSALVSALQQALADDDWVDRCGAEARLTIQASYTVERIGSEYSDVYRTLLNAREDR